MSRFQAASQRFIRWLGLAVLAAALVVECSEEVDTLNEAAAKWVWNPEVQGLSDGTEDSKQQAATETFSILAKQAAKDTRKADEVLEHKTESVEKEENKLKETKEKLTQANKALAQAQAGEALMKLVKPKALPEEEASVEGVAEEESQTESKAKEQQQSLTEEVKVAEEKLENARKVIQADQKKKDEAASKGRALAESQIGSLSAADAEKKAAALVQDQNLLKQQTAEVEKQVIAEKVSIAKRAGEMKEISDEKATLEQYGDAAKNTAIATELKSSAEAESESAAAAQTAEETEQAAENKDKAAISSLETSAKAKETGDANSINAAKGKIKEEAKRLKRSKDSLKKIRLTKVNYSQLNKQQQRKLKRKSATQLRAKQHVRGLQMQMPRKNKIRGKLKRPTKLNGWLWQMRLVMRLG
jgi:hypothetical protein